MRRTLASLVLVLALAGGLSVRGLPWWGLAMVLVSVSGFAWWLSQCRHRGPLGLLPATTDIDGTALPPRWFCDSCGKTWAAHFEREHTPIQRFTGYDESKAVRAAKRASELADRQRALALQRAGLRPAARKARTTRVAAHAADTADVVPIGQGRRLAG
jgi:hypothetical protein